VLNLVTHRTDSCRFRRGRNGLSSLWKVCSSLMTSRSTAESGFNIFAFRYRLLIALSVCYFVFPGNFTAIPVLALIPSETHNARYAPSDYQGNRRHQ
jgi:hypothetical protein